jgi:D-alanyl-lipoteichoic acid acyltransferase DltB (MBOAT superfamily)
MNEAAEIAGPSRKDVVIRLLFTILFVAILWIVKCLIYLTVVFQYVYLLVALKHSEPVRAFANRLAAFAYQLIRYLTLNDNEKPFPFKPFPVEMEAPAEEVSFT